MVFKSSPWSKIILIPVGFIIGILGPKFLLAHTLSVQESGLESLQQAQILLAQRNYVEAERAFKTVLKEGKAESSVFRGLAKAYQGGNRLDQGEKFIKDYVVSHPPSSAAQYGWGYLLYLKGDDEDADRKLQNAIELDPENALAWNNRAALAARSTKSYTQAAQMVHRAIKINPKNSIFYNNLQSIYREMGNDGLFLAEFDRYLKKGPNSQAFGYGKAIAKTLRQEGFRFYAQGNLDSSIKKFIEMVKVYRKINYQEGLVPGFFSLGLLYEEKGEAVTAEKYFRQVLEINPNHIQARQKMKDVP